MRNFGILMMIFCMTCTYLCAESSDSLAFRQADSLFAAGEFRVAALEYEHAGFLSSNHDKKVIAALQRAECFKQLHEFEAARKTLLRIDLAILSDSMIYKVAYQSALCAYLDEQFADAASSLQQLYYFVQDSSLAYSALPLYGLVLNEMQQWPEAHLKMKNYILKSNLSGTQKDSLLNEFNIKYQSVNYPHLKSIKKAQALSAFFPGVGQWYAGYPVEGITNASLQLLSLGFGVYCFLGKYYITAVGLGFAMFQRFYLGAQNRLEYLVQKKNYEILRDYNSDLRALILLSQTKILTK